MNNDQLTTAPEPLARRLRAHPFDPISGVLGLVAVLVGLVAASGATDPLNRGDLGIWLAAAAIAAGVLMLPWSRRNRAE